MRNCKEPNVWVVRLETETELQDRTQREEEKYIHDSVYLKFWVVWRHTRVKLINVNVTGVKVYFSVRFQNPSCIQNPSVKSWVMSSIRKKNCGILHQLYEYVMCCVYTILRLSVCLKKKSSLDSFVLFFTPKNLIVKHKTRSTYLNIKRNQRNHLGVNKT